MSRHDRYHQTNLDLFSPLQPQKLKLSEERYDERPHRDNTRRRCTDQHPNWTAVRESYLVTHAGLHPTQLRKACKPTDLGQVRLASASYANADWRSRCVSQAPVGTERSVCFVRALFGPVVGSDYLTSPSHAISYIRVPGSNEGFGAKSFGCLT